MVGASVLYHLARMGWRDVCLIERSVLTAGSSWHAAGGFHALNADPNIAALQGYTIDLLSEIERESGQSVGMHMTGGMTLAGTQDRWEWLQSAYRVFQSIGIEDVRLITPEEAKEACPILSTHGIIGGMWADREGYIDTTGTVQAYAGAARKHGAEVIEHNRVLEPNQITDGWQVVTEKGTVTCEHVVNAAGLYKAGGARVDEATEMVHIGRDMVEAALSTAPRSIPCLAGARHRDVTLELGNLVFQPGAGAPHATDLKRGRRPGDATSYRELTRLTQYFDVLHMIPPLIEPQDVPMHLRHYFTMQTQLTCSDKFPFVFSRGSPQVAQSFEIMRDVRGLSDDEFHAAPHCYTIINTNSPRQIDIPMAQGLIDFARARQVSIVTPFTLMGAMAPITVAGAMTLSHAEALAAITLTQLARPSAPVCYGTFTSNVDMKSGAPAFGTPEHFQASLAAGQLARRLGLPWRCASGSAANINDAQAANETQFGNWGCLLAGATVVIHAAGWLEGGLTVSYEKLITDMEVLQMVAELCAGASASDADIGLSALEEVQPGGHFFGAAHTMERYQTEFYEPLIGDLSNFGTWTERGARDASDRALEKWQKILHDAPGPEIDPDRAAALEDYIARGTEAGGAPPES